MLFAHEPVMQHNGLPSGADLLSLDAQGAEELVLISAVDPAVFKVIMVEMDGFDKAKQRRIHSLILKAGLKQANKSFTVPYTVECIPRKTSLAPSTILG